MSGISSGGYMAGQFHIAHSAAVRGAAILAAGPYDCAENTMTLALGRCLSGTPEIPVERLVGITGELAAAGRIDAVSGLAGDRVWLFHGAQDTVVQPAVGAALERYYRAYIAPGDLARATLPNAAHTFPTLESGASCAASEPPFVGACGFDAAGALLTHLYGALEPRGAASDGELTRFDQRPYERSRQPRPRRAGLALRAAELQRRGTLPSAHRLSRLQTGCGDRPRRGAPALTNVNQAMWRRRGPP